MSLHRNEKNHISMDWLVFLSLS